MRILYVSVHQILEFDEVSIFLRSGHHVFSLGSFFGPTASEGYRPVPPFTDDLTDDMALFEKLGGRYRYGAPAAEQVIPRAFVETFDVVVVMHDFDFIDLHWDALSATKVVWRSIGVGTQQFEPRVEALRARGVVLVRYCPIENRADGYAGHDAVIRFGKIGPTNGWIGTQPEILTFSHAFRNRFPVEYDFYRAGTAGLPAVLGGDGNADVPGALGVVDFDEQKRLFRDSALYFYASGSFIPYTLNFMEAWLTGIPVVAIDCRAIYTEDQCRFAEIPYLLDNGRNGFLVRSPEEAAAVFRQLLNEPEMARSVGAAGATKAHELFSSDVVAPKWERLFQGLGAV